MSKYSRDAFEAYCEANNIEMGRTVCVFEAWAKLQSERDELLDALKVSANFIPTTAIHEYQINFDGDLQNHSVSVKKLINAAIQKAEADK